MGTRSNERKRDAGGSIDELFAGEEAVDSFFAPEPVRPRGGRPRAISEPRPSHYKVVSISLYTEDIERLNQLVAELKARGHSRANKSMLIREALRQLDLDAVPDQR